MSAELESSEPPPLLGEVQWRSWLLAQRPLVAVAAGLGLPVLAALVWHETGSLVLAIFALLAIAFAAWRALVPIEFSVDDGGVKQRCFQRRQYDRWLSFAAFSRLPHGYLLWRVESPCPLDAMDGLFLPQPPQDNELLEILRSHLAEI